MFELRAKQNIINIAEGNVVVDEAKHVFDIKGFGHFETASIRDVVMSRALTPKVQKSTFSVTAPGVAGEAIFYIKVKSERHQAEYHNDRIQFGKRIPVSVSIAAGDAEADIKTKIGNAITAQNDAYQDLPFTCNGTNIDGKAGKEYISLDADGAVMTKNDGTVINLVWSITVTQKNSMGYGTGRQLEEDVSMLLPSNGPISAAKSDEKPIPSAKYASFSFDIEFNSNSVAAPSFVGEVAQSGKWSVTIWVNENELGDGEIDQLIDELFTKCSVGKMIGADGADKYNADVAIAKAAFLA